MLRQGFVTGHGWLSNRSFAGMMASLISPEFYAARESPWSDGLRGTG